MVSISKKYAVWIVALFLTIVIVVCFYVSISVISNSSIRPSSDSEKISEGFTCPRIQHPNFSDSFTWSKIFNVRFNEMGTPLYGVNIFQVQEKNLAAIIKNEVDQGVIGLLQGFGQIHAIKTYPVENSDLYTVVFIYDWQKNPWDLIASKYTKLVQTWEVFNFFRMAEAFNWVGTKNIESDLSVYTGMLDREFHADLCSAEI